MIDKFLVEANGSVSVSINELKRELSPAESQMSAILEKLQEAHGSIDEVVHLSAQ